MHKSWKSNQNLVTKGAYFFLLMGDNGLVGGIFPRALPPPPFSPFSHPYKAMQYQAVPQIPLHTILVMFVHHWWPRPNYPQVTAYEHFPLSAVQRNFWDRRDPPPPFSENLLLFPLKITEKSATKYFGSEMTFGSFRKFIRFGGERRPLAPKDAL